MPNKSPRAPKGQQRIAQGSALGNGGNTPTDDFALQGQNHKCHCGMMAFLYAKLFILKMEKHASFLAK